jgi:hypothetical protein
VPASGVTIFLSSPINEFRSDDLPTFGLPTIANLARSSSGFSSFNVKFFTRVSRSSPVPEPFIDEMENKSPIPNL